MLDIREEWYPVKITTTSKGVEVGQRGLKSHDSGSRFMQDFYYLSLIYFIARQPC
ncbi:hypothetical protein D3C87_1505110 [compost metagenome]